MLKYNEKIVCRGQIAEKYPYSEEKYTLVNYSSIFSELIQAAGMGCEYYASDMFITLEYIKKAIDNLESITEYIGIRDSGVDGTNFIKCRIDKHGCDYTKYIKLYKLETGIIDGDYIMTLYRIDEYDARNELLNNLFYQSYGKKEV